MQWIAALTKSQWWAGGRNWISFGAGILAALGIVSATQQAELLHTFDDLMASLIKVATDIGIIITFFAPIINGWIAAHKASPTENIKTVAAIATDKAQPETHDAKVALLSAAASMPEASKIILTNKMLADAVPSAKVV